MATNYLIKHSSSYLRSLFQAVHLILDLANDIFINPASTSPYKAALFTLTDIAFILAKS